jgi:hypothetical protein
MKYLRALTVLLVLTSGSAFATERYTEARITEVEANDTVVVVFLEVISGSAPPAGNGNTNDTIAKPYLLLTNSASDIANRKHLLSNALVALSAGSTVRFRWEDAGTNAGRVIAMLVRS